MITDFLFFINSSFNLENSALHRLLRQSCHAIEPGVCPLIFFMPINLIDSYCNIIIVTVNDCLILAQIYKFLSQINPFVYLRFFVMLNCIYQRPFHQCSFIAENRRIAEAEKIRT